MPVSRKRKKSSQPAAAAKASRRRERTRQVKQANALRLMYAGWETAAAERVEQARPHARELVEHLLKSPATGAAALEDELCARLGPLLTDLADRTPADVSELLDSAGRDRLDELVRNDDYIGPQHFAEALADAVAELGTPAGAGGDPEDAAVRRVAAAVTAVLPSPLRQRTGLELPDPELRGEMRWTRDRYGSRFAVVAPFAVPGAPVRWYLWDIDACAFAPVPVHAGFYASPEEALAAWQVGVGPAAAGGTAWQAVDDSTLLRRLLPDLDGLVALGGETVEQHAEYLRCRRLAEVLLDLAPLLPITREDPRPALVAGWLRRWDDAPAQERDAAHAVAMAWPDDIPALYESCSPHRVAYVVQSLREEYPDDDLAEKAVALLPRWLDWMVEYTGMPAELAERARPYAEGREHPNLPPGDRGAHQARVIE